MVERAVVSSSPKVGSLVNDREGGKTSEDWGRGEEDGKKRREDVEKRQEDVEERREDVEKRREDVERREECDGNATNKMKTKAKRNKWTEQETKDLLMGVARFGIGSWKKILGCDDFRFSGRSTVDLKDRFRTCCPDEYKKFRASDQSIVAATKPPQRSKDATSKTQVGIAGSYSSQTQSPHSRTARKSRGGTHRKGPAELAEMGIDGPFFKNKRRERREFTDRDDNALLRGFDRHGPTWHAIRSDPELGFSSRHPTDLRDRFRTRFPEKYAKAGYKVKSKEAKKRSDEGDDSQFHAKGNNPSDHATGSNKRTSGELHSSTARPNASNPSSSDPKSKQQNLLKPLLTAFPFDDFPDLASDDDASYSPITLSRNIFQWADAHPPQANTAAPVNNSAAPADITSHLNFNMLANMDQYHINPLATLKLPSTSTTSYPQTTTAATSMVSSATMAPIHAISSKPSHNAIGYPPSLPILTFPSVPASGSRGSGLNLPPPADLLSGLELDGRGDGQSGAFLWEEGIGMGGVSAGASGSTTGTAIGSIKGLFESEGLGERSLLNSSV